VIPVLAIQQPLYLLELELFLCSIVEYIIWKRGIRLNYGAFIKPSTPTHGNKVSKKRFPLYSLLFSLLRVYFYSVMDSNHICISFSYRNSAHLAHSSTGFSDIHSHLGVLQA
jgi:hypothetical protein